MPLPLPRQTAAPQHKPHPADSAHHFDVAHGDVAALHARIESRFSEPLIALLPPSPLAERLEIAVQTISRASGVIGLGAALTGIAFLIF